MQKNALTMSLAVVALLGLAGCSNTSSTGTSTASSSTAPTALQAAITDAESLSRADLMKKAVTELKAAGNGAKIKVLAVTSRGGKDAAKIEFIKELNAAGASYDETTAASAPVAYSSTVDGQIYTTLTGEISNNVNNNDGAILQDGYQLQKKFIDKGYFTNYIPKEWKDDATTLKNGNDNPFTLQYNFKTWMYNNKGLPNMKIDNIWDITSDAYKGKLLTMDPKNENVNMDWLIMLTQPDQAAALKAAFNADSNDNKTLDLTKYADKAGDLKYSYAFIDKYIENAVFYADDGKAVDALAKTPGSIGWIVYSKIQNIKETADTSKKNIVIAALGNENSDGTNPGSSKVAGFGGFMYKHYMSLMPTTKMPYTTMAFFNVLSTTVNGYKAWAEDVGDYPSMVSINLDRTKNGHGTLATTADSSGVFAFTQKADDSNVFPCLNDPTATWWNDTAKVIVETPSFIGSNYASVFPFINTAIANKN
jgi:iron(III) transport system substrate-binding protein